MARHVFIFLLLFSACNARAVNYVWWEAENPGETNFPAKSPFRSATFPDRAALLSNSDWLSSGGKRGKDTLYAKYQLTTPTTDRLLPLDSKVLHPRPLPLALRPIPLANLRPLLRLLRRHPAQKKRQRQLGLARQTKSHCRPPPL